MNFNTEQEKAISSDFPLTIIAGPGSGKTATIIEKIIRLVDNEEELKKFIILTFTNGAANNIIKKLEDKFSSSSNKNIKIEKKDYHIGTFHSIFFKMLKDNSIEFSKSFDFPINIKIIDPNEDLKIFKTIIRNYYNKDSKLKIKEMEENFQNIHEVTILDIYNSLISLSNKKPKDLNFLIDRTLMESYSENQKEILILENVLKDFINHKREEGLLSFNDILFYTYLFFNENQDIKNIIKNKFEYLFIDEYQDTNPTQDAIIKFISGNNDCEVGDGYQSIYKFLGAEIDNILNLIKEEDRNVVQLTKNYRSTENIVSFTNDLTTLFTKKIPNFIPCTSESIGLENKKIVLKDYCNQEDEIIEHIKESIQNGISPSDIAIITRNNFEYEIEKKLLMNNINYKKISGKGFYQKKEILALIDLIKVLKNDFNFINFRNTASFIDGLGDKVLDKVSNSYVYRENKDNGIKNIIEDEYTSNKKLILCSEILLNENEKLSYKNIIEIIDSEDLNIRKKLINEGQTIKKQNDIEKSIEFFLNEIKDILLSNSDDIINEYIYNISLDSKKDKDIEDCITLTTAHSSKGLEWRNCYIINASDGKFPGIRSLEYDSQLEEEKRLFYVAISRAKEFLMITSSSELNQFIEPFMYNDYFEYSEKNQEDENSFKSWF